MFINPTPEEILARYTGLKFDDPAHIKKLTERPPEGSDLFRNCRKLRKLIEAATPSSRTTLNDPFRATVDAIELVLTGNGRSKGCISISHLADPHNPCDPLTQLRSLLGMILRAIQPVTDRTYPEPDDGLRPYWHLDASALRSALNDMGDLGYWSDVDDVRVECVAVCLYMVRARLAGVERFFKAAGTNFIEVRSSPKGLCAYRLHLVAEPSGQPVLPADCPDWFALIDITRPARAPEFREPEESAPA